MRYISIDVETTGLNANVHQIIEIGAVIEDTVYYKSLSILPMFYCMVEHEQYTGTAYPLQLNHRIFKELAIPTGTIPIYKSHEVVGKFIEWLIENEFTKDEEKIACIIQAAGKNFASFDKLFLEKLPKWKDLIHFRHRNIDPVTLFVDWKKDEILPSLKTCMERANITGEVTHNAYEDALQVIKILRTKYFPISK